MEDNQRHLLTVTALHVKRGKDRKMRPDACTDSGRPETTKITSIEQIVGSLLARVAALETGAASSSSGPDSARSWNVLGHSDGSTTSGSLGFHGPGSHDDNRKTRLELDTFPSPEDEHARSAVSLRFPCAQINDLPVRNTLKSRLRVSQACTRNKSQTSGLCGQRYK